MIFSTNRPGVMTAFLVALSVPNIGDSASFEDTWGGPPTWHFVGFEGPHFLSENGSVFITATISPSVDLSQYRFSWTIGTDNTWLEFETIENSMTFRWEDLAINGFSTVVGTTLNFSANPVPIDDTVAHLWTVGAIGSLTIIPEPASTTLGVGLLSIFIMFSRRTRWFSR